MSVKLTQTAPIRALLGLPVAFYRSLARICGSVNAGLLLSQAIYWSDRTSDGSGWFYKTREEWAKEIFLSRSEQETARRILKERGFLREELRSVPAKVHFLVDIDRVGEALSELAENQPTRRLDSRQPGSRISTNSESGQQGGRKGTNLLVENQQPFLIGTEITAESTSVSTAAALKVWCAIKAELHEQLDEQEWQLWVRPAYLLKVMSDNSLLIALPPNNRITQAARASLPVLRAMAQRHGYGGVNLTRYPDQDDRERLKQEFPEFYEQMFGNRERKLKPGPASPWYLTGVAKQGGHPHQR